MHKLTKIATVTESSEDGLPRKEFYVSDNRDWVVGEPTETPQIGRYLSLRRLTKNGVETPGIMITTPVVKFDDITGILHTKNSIYRLEEIDDKVSDLF